MKKILPIVPFLVAGMTLIGCGDKSSRDNTSGKQDSPTVSQDSLGQYLSTARLMDMADTLEDIDYVQDKYSWMGAMSVCPNGYRLPTVEEFKKLTSRIAEFSKDNESGWWTAHVVDSPDNSSNYAGAIIAKLSGNATEFTFTRVSAMESAKVKCVQDTTDNKIVVNETTQKVSETEGAITEAILTPYYEPSLNNMGCSDCCCEEGNGGVLDVTLKAEGKPEEKFQIKELSDVFCGALAFNENNTPKDVQKASDGCIPEKLENFNILQLFQPGVKVKRTSCQSYTYLFTPAQQTREEATCGETILLNFAGKVQDISLAQNSDPEAEKECNYTILMNGSEKAVTTKGTCSNAEPGKDYNIQVTVSLDAQVSKDANPVVSQEYPCCYGEIQSHQITDISFTPVNN